MNDLIQAITAALAADATAETRSAGAQACRTILAALDATAGEPITAAVATPVSPIATIVAAMRGVPADQLLDLAIQRLRAALPAGVEVPAAPPLKFNIVPVPRG